jgi:hypothetical protein
MILHREPTVKANISDEEIINIINESIKNGTPTSISRCGDGEMHILKNENDFITGGDKIIHYASMISILKRNAVFNCTRCKDEKGNPLACRCYLNSKNATNWINDMRGIIVDTIKRSDYIGLNCPKVDQRWYGISESVLRRYDINVNSLKITTSDWPKHKLIGDPIEFKKILNGRPIHMITSRVRNFQRIQFESYLGSPITYTSLNDEEGTTNMSYYQRKELIDSLSNIKEDIVVLGGGAYIKDLIPILKNDYGKICLDMGSVLDIWSGIVSRKVFLAESKHCNWLNINK